jgi:hypothetical protein
MGWAGHQAALVFSRSEGIGVAVLTNAGSNTYALSHAAAAVGSIAE